jgi:DNA-binding CsgD family transcriptional regulator
MKMIERIEEPTMNAVKKTSFLSLGLKVHGNKGKKYKLSQFTDQEVVSIRLSVNDGAYYRDIASHYGCSVQTISKLAKGITYNHVEPAKCDNLSHRGRGNRNLGRIAKVTEAEYYEILDKFKSGQSLRKIAENYDITYETVRKYCKRLVGKPMRLGGDGYVPSSFKDSK